MSTVMRKIEGFLSIFRWSYVEGDERLKADSFFDDARDIAGS